MSTIKQMLRLHQQGVSKKKASRVTGLSRTTIRNSLRKVRELGTTIDELIALEDHELEHKLHAGDPSYKKEERYEQLKGKLGHYIKELERPGVTRRLLWEEYREADPQGYGYTQFCAHISQYLKASKPSMVLHHEPGEKLFVDFAGKKIAYIDRETGEEVECPVFVACMPYSDFGFAMAVRTQSIADFLFALSCCLKALGGVPKVLVPDNLKAAVKKANNYEPEVGKAMEDFANHYGVTVIPTRAAKPKDKALVENQVRLVYSRVFAKLRDRRFFDLGSINQAMSEKMRDHNQTRMQQKPYCREERFLAEERPLLGPLPREDFELKYYKFLKVAKNNHVHLWVDKRHYSVPYRYIGRKVKVIFTRSMVRVYVEGQQIAAHIRVRSSGYSTIKDHLCSQHQHYLDRSEQYYKDRARRISGTFHELIEAIFDLDRYPEQLYKRCDGLLQLQRHTEPEAFEKACRMAIEHESYTYQFIRNILTNKMTAQQEHDHAQKPLPKHENVRGSAYYEQLKLKF